MKSYEDSKRHHLEFKVGESVYLKLLPYRQASLPKRPNEKLLPHFYGPFLILQKIGQVAYKLDLPASSKIHNVFHIT